jgi:hypothetical protein
MERPRGYLLLEAGNCLRKLGIVEQNRELEFLSPWLRKFPDFLFEIGARFCTTCPYFRVFAAVKSEHPLGRNFQAAKLIHYLQFFRITQVLGFGGSASAVSANELGITNIFFIFLEIVFYKPNIISHAKMGFVPGMGLRDLQFQRKPFRHK